MGYKQEVMRYFISTKHLLRFQILMTPIIHVSNSYFYLISHFSMSTQESLYNHKSFFQKNTNQALITLPSGDVAFTAALSCPFVTTIVTNGTKGVANTLCKEIIFR